jgi:MFS family permease
MSPEDTSAGCGEGREERECVEVMEADVTAPPAELLERTIFRGGALSAFGYHDYRLLWSGAFVSNLGTWIHMTALLWYVKLLTGSDAWVSAVNLANLLPVLFLALYAGSLADRFNRKGIIVITQAAMMASALALAVFASLGRADLPVIMITTAAMGVSFAFNFPAWRSVIPDLVKGEDILNGIALDAAGFNMARFAGPALGALILTAWGADAAFYINAASFLAVIVGVLLIRTPTPGLPVPAGGTGRHIAEVLSYVRRHRWALNLLLVMAVYSLCGLPYIVLLPGLARDTLHGGAAAYGLLLGFTGLGAAAAAPALSLVSRRFGEGAIVKYAGLASSLLLLTACLSRNLWVSVAISFGLGACYLTLSSTVNTVLQARVERKMRGRMVALIIVVLQGLYPVGGMALGWLSDLRSVPFALGLGGLACLSMSLATIAFPAILRDV